MDALLGVEAASSHNFACRSSSMATATLGRTGTALVLAVGARRASSGQKGYPQSTDKL
jgi:hypothetical protein